MCVPLTSCGNATVIVNVAIVDCASPSRARIAIG